MHVGSYVNEGGPSIKCTLSMFVCAHVSTQKPLLMYPCAHMCPCLQTCPNQHAEVNKHVFHIYTMWLVEPNDVCTVIYL